MMECDEMPTLQRDGCTREGEMNERDGMNKRVMTKKRDMVREEMGEMNERDWVEGGEEGEMDER